MTADEKRALVIGAEGCMLENVKRAGVDHVAEYARCYVDGTMNALIRMEGRDRAAEFASQLADRVILGAREPTQCILSPLPRPPEPPPTVEALPPGRMEIVPSAHGAYRAAAVYGAYALGALQGGIIAFFLVVGFWR